MNGDTNLISKREAAKMIGCGVRTLDSWMRDGKLQYYKLGKLVRFDRNEFIAFINACKSGPVKSPNDKLSDRRRE